MKLDDIEDGNLIQTDIDNIRSDVAIAIVRYGYKNGCYTLENIQRGCISLIKQMQLKQFLKKYPLAALMLPKELDSSDDKYYVRFTDDFKLLEFGYLSDTWTLSV